MQFVPHSPLIQHREYHCPILILLEYLRVLLYRFVAICNVALESRAIFCPQANSLDTRCGFFKAVLFQGRRGVSKA
jgi:hypothetical protein